MNETGRQWNPRHARSRRSLLKGLLGSLVPLLLPVHASLAGESTVEGLLRRRIPGTQESIPIAGLGTSDEFDRVPDASVRRDLKRVLRGFFDRGGRLIDTAPIYGRSEAVLGELMEELGVTDEAFIATKVRTRSESEGRQQIEASFRHLGTDVIDLLQVHSLVGWKTQLPLLQSIQQTGRVRYIGVTHHRPYAYDDLAFVLRNHRVDFLQCAYSVAVREAESELLPLARRREVAVMINRPFENGRLFRIVRNQPVPRWCQERGIQTWSQFFLKFVLSHPAVTCVIPATSNPAHLTQNIQAGTGHLPDPKQRARMIEDWNRIS